MELKISNVCAQIGQPRWVLFVIDQQHLAVDARGIESLYPSSQTQGRFSAFLAAELHVGRPVFMRPLTELFQLADPHFFAANQARSWCLVIRGVGPTRLGCWVDAVAGPVIASASMGQVMFENQTYLTASLLPSTGSSHP